ncbi:MAG: heparinase II/III family protein [Deltaproteobacteria bacterium]|nr:heparinase II/III family protein [Deltaproteobacteria bacterium]
MAPASLPTWHLFPQKGIFAWRSSWQDDATYFSLKSGSYFGGHEHPDAGHFILHRAGVPYLTDHGYSYWKDTAEHNLILVDGAGQFGEGGQWMADVDPAHWATVDSALGDEAYFDLVADPTAMVQAETLDSWKREVVGLGSDILIIEDVLVGSAPMDLDWLLHSYASSPPSNINQTYSYKELRTQNPWTEVAAGHWLTQPQPGVAALHVQDASFAAWTATLEPSIFVPEQHPDEGGYNSSLESYQVGARLRRSATGVQLRSTVALWFGDALAAEPWSTATVEAVRLHDGGNEVVQVLWPTGASVAGFHSFDVTAAMAGRRFDEPAYFGRQVTQLDHQGVELIDATGPVDLFARLEHSPSSADPLRVVTEAAAETSVTLHCPSQPTTVLLDGGQVTFNWASSRLTLTVPAGQHRFELQ